MEILGKLLGSVSRVKIMRLFLFHPQKVFSYEDVKKRTRVTPATFRKEINLLLKVGFLEQKEIPADVLLSDGKKVLARKPKVGLKLSPDFPFADPFRTILINAETLKKETIAKSLEGVGKLKLVILSGIFIGRDDSRVDLFVVGSKINKKAFENYMRILESEIGKELAYSVLETDEFAYRYQVHDKLVRDVLDYPHEKLLDRLNV
ncbi:MAG TPA: hypothetical protein VFM02_02865 [Candidatus Paceibacterota bacterium]|nr:hypothetical protein [Candidatus Paceibacterota bacterium]